MKCKHNNLSHLETIEAFHESTIDENGELDINMSVGNKIRDEVTCLDCSETWVVTNSSPEFVRKHHYKIQSLWDEQNGIKK